MKKQIQKLKKKISTMCTISRIREISVLVVIGMVLGAGLIPIMNGYQIQTSVIKNDHVELDTSTKIADLKLQELNKNDFSFTEFTGIMTNTWKTLSYKQKLIPHDFVADSNPYNDFPVTKYLFTSNFFTSYLFTSNLFANKVTNSYRLNFYSFIKPFLKYPQTTHPVTTQTIPPQTTQTNPPETTQTTPPDAPQTTSSATTQTTPL